MSLDDASQKRKERLALLSATKRKREDHEPITATTAAVAAADTLTREKNEVEAAMKFRNYDPETNAPKLGFLDNPADAQADTVEKRAAELTASAAASANSTATDTDTPLDIDAIQAKKPNWDLKRDLERRMQPLKARQEVIVARLVRERLLRQKRAGENGMEDANLVRQIEQHERDLSRQTLATQI